MEEQHSHPDTPQEIRRRIRAGEFDHPTARYAQGFVQVNLAIMQETLALEFLSFCIRNPAASPLFDILPPLTDEIGKIRS